MRVLRLCAPMTALCLLLLCSCGGAEELQQVQLLRERYAAAAGCAGTAEVTADYGQRVYEFTLDFAAQGEELTLTLTAPEEVAGITARVSGEQTSLEYDGAILDTGALSPDGLSPVSAVPLLLRSAAEGFSDRCVWEGEKDAPEFHVTYRDPERSPGEGTEVDLWFAGDTGDLLRGEVSVDGYRVILCEFTAFSLTRGEDGQT